MYCVHSVKNRGRVDISTKYRTSKKTKAKKKKQAKKKRKKKNKNKTKSNILICNQSWYRYNKLGVNIIILN